MLAASVANDAFDVQFFDSVDFDLLEDNGNFEQFCLSMDFDPLVDERAELATVGGPPTQPSGRKRKLGTQQSQNSINVSYEGQVYSPHTDSSSISSSGASGLDSDINNKRKEKKTSSSATSKADRKNTKLSPDSIVTKYPDMFCRIFNNFDRTEFSDLVKKHCENELLVIYEFVGHNPYEGPKYMEVRGLETVAVFWDNLLSAIPDSVYENHATKFKVLPNGFISVVCSFSFRGTKVSRMSGVDDTNNAANNVVLSMEHPGNNSANQSLPMQAAHVVASRTIGEGKDTPIDEDSKQVFGMRPAAVSVQMMVVGTLTFYVNPACKIYRMSFVHSMKTNENSLSRK